MLIQFPTLLEPPHGHFIPLQDMGLEEYFRKQSSEVGEMGVETLGSNVRL